LEKWPGSKDVVARDRRETVSFSTSVRSRPGVVKERQGFGVYPKVLKKTKKNAISATLQV
jgi:hypothetical protein